MATLYVVYYLLRGFTIDAITTSGQSLNLVQGDTYTLKQLIMTTIPLTLSLRHLVLVLSVVSSLL